MFVKVKNVKNNMEEIEAKARIMKALSHPIRLCIVRGLMCGQGYNVSEIQECLNIPQSTLSQHLIKLKDLGILENEREGVNIRYYVVDEDAKNIIKTLFSN